MTDKPKTPPARLRLVASNDKPTAPTPPAGARSHRYAKLPRLSEPFVRVRLSWLDDPRWHHLSAGAVRLYLLLIHYSYEGRRQICLSRTIETKYGIPPRQRRRWLAELERAGLVIVSREGHKAPPVSLSLVVGGRTWMSE